ncbi:hypothetical protein ABTH43_19390, partial [Acinetobacter baumannii]
ATANGSQNSPTGAATYRPSKLTPTGLRNRRATPLSLETRYRRKIAAKQVHFAAQTRTYRVSYRTTCQKIYSVGIGITLEFPDGSGKIGPG